MTDKILANLVERAMKSIAIEHARKCGATEEQIKQFEELDTKTLWSIVVLFYGDPRP